MRLPATRGGEAVSNTGAKPHENEERVLRVPTTPQREHFLDLAGALLDYIEDGGAVCYLMGGAGPQAQEVVSFAVDRRLFREYERKRAAPRRGPPPRWVPGRGFSRRG